MQLILVIDIVARGLLHDLYFSTSFLVSIRLTYDMSIAPDGRTSTWWNLVIQSTEMWLKGNWKLTAWHKLCHSVTFPFNIQLTKWQHYVVQITWTPLLTWIILSPNHIFSLHLPKRGKNYRRTAFDLNHITDELMNVAFSYFHNFMWVFSPRE